MAAATAGAAIAGGLVGGGVSSASGLLGSYLQSGRDLYRDEVNQGYAIQNASWQNFLDTQRDSKKADLDLRNQIELANLQHSFDLSKFQDTVADLKKAGINIGALGASGLQAPSVSYSGNSARTVSSANSANLPLPSDSTFQKSIQAFIKKNPDGFSKTFRSVAVNSAKALSRSLKAHR